MKAPLDESPEPTLPVVCRRVDGVLARLAWMRSEGIWPTGPRCLWTDAYGLVLLVSLHRLIGEARFLDEACWLAAAVERVLGRELGMRSAATELGVKRFHHLGMWIFALGRLGRVEPTYRSQGIDLARAVHEQFVLRELGLRRRDLGESDPRYEPGSLDSFLGYVAYRSLDERELSAEIADMREKIERSYRDLVITQDEGLGMMLWLTHFHPKEHWAELQRGRCLRVLEYLWVDPPGCFCREPGLTTVKSPVANHGISIGLQAVAAMPERVEKLGRFFHRSRDDDRQGIAHVMACCADLPGEILCTRENA